MKVVVTDAFIGKAYKRREALNKENIKDGSK